MPGALPPAGPQASPPRQREAEKGRGCRSDTESPGKASKLWGRGWESNDDLAQAGLGSPRGGQEGGRTSGKKQARCVQAEWAQDTGSTSCGAAGRLTSWDQVAPRKPQQVLWRGWSRELTFYPYFLLLQDVDLLLGHVQGDQVLPRSCVTFTISLLQPQPGPLGLCHAGVVFLDQLGQPLDLQLQGPHFFPLKTCSPRKQAESLNSGGLQRRGHLRPCLCMLSGGTLLRALGALFVVSPLLQSQAISCDLLWEILFW